MSKGDHIFVNRGLYDHHGIDVGRGMVIHYTGELGRKAGAAIRCTNIAAFAKGAQVHVAEYGDNVHSSKVVVNRAKSRVGESAYDLVFNNCEHFARWCKTDQARSVQVERTTGGAVGNAGAGAAAAAGLGVVSAGGAVAGLSGSGIMSGLAAAGAVVGGGAVAGIAVLGTGPAVVANKGIRYAFQDDPSAGEPERAACTAARTAGVVGSLAGTGGAIAAVSGLGSVAGLSGAGITSGLAALGGTVGGGMLAGTAITVAAPAVAASALAYGAYRLVRFAW